MLTPHKLGLAILLREQSGEGRLGIGFTIDINNESNGGRTWGIKLLNKLTFNNTGCRTITENLLATKQQV